MIDQELLREHTIKVLEAAAGPVTVSQIWRALKQFGHYGLMLHEVSRTLCNLQLEDIVTMDEVQSRKAWSLT